MKLSEFKKKIIKLKGQKDWEYFKETNGYKMYMADKEEQKRLLDKNENYIGYINNPSEEMQIKAIQKNGYAIKYINNPSKKVQLLAVKNSPYFIQYIKNPSEEIQLLAVSEVPALISNIKNPSERTIEQAILSSKFSYDYENILIHIENDLKEEVEDEIK